MFILAAYKCVGLFYILQNKPYPACNVIRCLRLNVLLYTSAFRVVMVDTFVKSVSSKPPIGKGVDIVSTLLGATEPYSYPRISEI